MRDVGVVFPFVFHAVSIPAASAFAFPPQAAPRGDQGVTGHCPHHSSADNADFFLLNLPFSLCPGARPGSEQAGAAAGLPRSCASHTERMAQHPQGWDQAPIPWGWQESNTPPVPPCLFPTFIPEKAAQGVPGHGSGCRGFGVTITELMFPFQMNLALREEKTNPSPTSSC